MNRKFLAALALSASFLASSAAHAGPIIYTFSGTFTGTLNGNAFETPATFTGVGDTDTFSTNGFTKFVNLSSLSALAGGTTYNITTTTQFYLNVNNYAGLFFGSAGNGGGGFAGTGPGLAGYDAVSGLGTTAFTDHFTGPVTFNTDQGTVQLSSFTNGSFGASVAGAIPEPSTWALMIVGFGAVGAAMRRRKSQVAVTVSYA